MIFTALAAMAVTASSPRYSLVNQNGFWWFAGPDKKPFFSFGVCCVNTGASFLGENPRNREYAAYRYYPTGKRAWAEDTIGRLLSWNFNTIGAWSDAKTLSLVKAPDLHFTPILHMGSGAGAPWRDMWDPKIVRMMNDIARDQIKEFNGDQRVIGYFSDNEQGWWYGAIFDWIWKGPYARVKATNLLEARYKTWAALMRDFEPEGAIDFSGLRKSGRLYVRSGSHGIEAVGACVELVAGRYYSLCNSIIKKFDPGALYLGDRYISNFYPAVARAAGKVADVVSTNLNADWDDGTFSPFFLPSLRRNSNRPVMITEYYVAAMQNRSGNLNDSSGFLAVRTQEDRAKVFLKSTNIFLSTPYVVGAHWFQYYDEPALGRGDGENYDMGLVDLDNKPYDEVVNAASTLNLQDRPSADTTEFSCSPFVFPEDVADLERWPRQEAYMKPVLPSDRGDAFVAWTPEAALVAVYWNEDRFPEALYKGGKVPVVDEPFLTISANGNRSSIRFIEKASKISGSAKLVSLKMGVRNAAILRIPASVFGVRELTPGTKLPLSMMLQTRSRGYTIRWTGTKAIEQ